MNNWFFIIIHLTLSLCSKMFIRNNISRKLILLCTSILALCYISLNISLLKISFLKTFYAILIAYLLYLLSCFIVGTKFNKENLLFSNIKKLNNPLKKFYIKESFENIYKATIEEILYRGLFQLTICELGFKGSHILAMILTIVYFSFMHPLKKYAIIQKLDLISFAIIITFIFELSNSLVMVSIIHILRNWFIINQKYSDYWIEEKRKKQILKFIRRKNHENKS